MAPACTMEDRYVRHADIIPRDLLEGKTVTVVGVGAIGRQVALQLTAIGVPKLQLVDFDTVEVENLSVQGFLETDLGKSKVGAVADLCRKLNSDVEVIEHNCRFNKLMNLGDVLFSCVDKMSVRRFIWEAIKEKENRPSLLVDARMAAETFRIVSADLKVQSDIEKYEKSLFSDSEAFRGRCTSKSTIYNANIAAGFAVCQFTKWLRGFPAGGDFQINILANEIVQGDDNEGFEE